MSTVPATERLAAGDVEIRLQALRELAASLTASRPASRPEARASPRPTNVHVHTNHSFGVFRSPSEAVWHAAQAGIEVFGINDFFTTAGCGEFARACAAAGIAAVFGVECVAIDPRLAAEGLLVNDPANPGKIYLTGKGIARPDDALAAAELARLRGFQERRNRELTASADARFRAILGEPGPTWDDVSGQTPAGNTTERHVARAIVRALAAPVGRPVGSAAWASAYERVVGKAPPSQVDAELQNHVRSHLLKAGKPCYVAEDPAAFPTVAGLRSLYLSLGSIPTYPVLGDPITDGERDIASWCDRLDGWGFRALELIPARNTEPRMTAVVAEATRRGWPVFDGTEHNTPAMEPMTTRWGLDERFRPRLREGALVLLGHQRRVAVGSSGYVDACGDLVPGGYRACLDAGVTAVDEIGRFARQG